MAPNNSIDLTGKIAIVTGSGKENGIGAGIATALARAGARVAINYVSEATEPRANQVVAEIQRIAGKGTVTALQADIRTPAGAKKLIDGTLAGFGVDHVDILVNNAAWSKLGPALDSTPEDTLKCFEVNVFGPLYLMQFAVPHMPRGGRIINVGSVASKLGIAGMPLYVASKGAMDALTFVLARELGRDGKGITINTVLPGPVLTDSLPTEVPEVKALVDWLVSLTRAEERPGTVEDIADAVLLLASEQSRWITGQNISVSGGITGG